MNSMEEIIEDIKIGKPVIIVDAENRENEGDIIVSAEKLDYDTLNFIIKECRGLLCVPIEEEVLEKKGLNQMIKNSSDTYKTAFTISVDSKETTTGISISDRLKSVKKFISNWKLDDFRLPGHIFPLAAKKGGVFKREGHTEASIDLMKIAGLKPVSIICEILKEDGTMARLADLKIFAKRHNLKIFSIEKLIEYRKKNEIGVEKIISAKLPTVYGDFKIEGFENILDTKEHFVLQKGDIKNKKSVLVRVHSECLTGDLLGSKKCDCGEQLHKSMKKINDEGEGVIIYLRQEGRGIGFFNKIRAYNYQDKGLDTIEANHKIGFENDLRDYVIAAWILKYLKVESIRLISNNPEKISSLKKYGIKIDEVVKLDITFTNENKKYLDIKKNRMGHFF